MGCDDFIVIDQILYKIIGKQLTKPLRRRQLSSLFSSNPFNRAVVLTTFFIDR